MLKSISTVVLMMLCVAVDAQTLGEKKPLNPELDYHAIGAPLPLFRMITMDTIPFVPQRPTKIKKRKAEQLSVETNQKYLKVITNKDLPTKGNTFIMTFNPTCGHCEDQADQFVKNLGSFKNAGLYMIANPVQKGYLSDFIKNHHLKQYPQIEVGIDSSGYINTTFLYGALPQINIYDHDKKLLKAYTGEVPIDSLVKYMD